MLRLLRVIPAALILTVCAPWAGAADNDRGSPTSDKAGAPDTPGTVVRRTTLIVHDMDASILFYRDVLGLELWLDSAGVVTERSLPSTAKPGEPSRLVIMKGRDPWIGMIGLLQYGDARSAPPPPARLLPGHTILMLETDDVVGIHERMQAAGTPVFREPRKATVTGADGSQWDTTFLFAFDPDGHLLEIGQPQGARR